jgi:CO/xanthine dehydrogenase Mo-binding subunit
LTAEAIERIDVDLEARPSSWTRPAAGGANGQLEGNVWFPAAPAAQPGGQPPRPMLRTLKWTEQDFANAPAGALPAGKAPDEWSYGDLNAGFKDAEVIVDETFVVQSTGHQPMETRTAMAYWQNGKLYLHGSTQSVVRTVDGLANWVGVDPSCRSRVLRRRRQQGSGAVSMATPAPRRRMRR